jgi:hypothetical protein
LKRWAKKVRASPPKKKKKNNPTDLSRKNRSQEDHARFVCEALFSSYFFATFSLMATHNCHSSPLSKIGWKYLFLFLPFFEAQGECCGSHLLSIQILYTRLYSCCCWSDIVCRLDEASLEEDGVIQIRRRRRRSYRRQT